MIHRLKPESYYWLVVRLFWLALTITVTLQVNRALTIWEQDRIKAYQIHYCSFRIETLTKAQEYCLDTHYGN